MRGWLRRWLSASWRARRDFLILWALILGGLAIVVWQIGATDGESALTVLGCMLVGCGLWAGLR